MKDSKKVRLKSSSSKNSSSKQKSSEKRNIENRIAEKENRENLSAESTGCIKKNVPLAQWTSWQVGGAAEFYASPSTNKELIDALEWAHKQSFPVTVLGQGTNVLVADSGVPGLVLHMKNFNQILDAQSDKDFFKVRCQAGALKSDLLKIFIKNKLAPALFLAGLPGDIGGGIVMNAGIGQKEVPREFCEIIHSFEVLRWQEDHIEAHKVMADEIQWEYRKSRGWQPGIISEVEIIWPNRPDENLLKKVREGNARRKKTQPLHQPSCGSVFKNPEGHFSGQLIENAGLKGFAIGGAQVSEKHANFIVNVNQASAQDIHDVMAHVEKTVFEKFQVRLTNEVVYFGHW